MKLKIPTEPMCSSGLFSAGAENLRIPPNSSYELVSRLHGRGPQGPPDPGREHEGDEITHASIRRLNTTFITPMDREDIYGWPRRSTRCSTRSRRLADLFVLHGIESRCPR